MSDEYLPFLAMVDGRLDCGKSVTPAIATRCVWSAYCQPSSLLPYSGLATGCQAVLCWREAVANITTSSSETPAGLAQT